MVDIGGGHGLLAHLMILLDDSSASGVVVDPSIPPSAQAVQQALVETWPRLGARVSFVAAALESIELTDGDIVVSSHACGDLTDRIIDRSVEARARLAVLPCCHDRETCDAGPLAGWLDAALAIDAMRAVRLEGREYRVWTQTIPASITPKNRLLIGSPRPR